MFKYKNKISTLYTAFLMILFATTWANVPVDPSNFTGSRNENKGITSTASWGDRYELDWSITENSGVFHYLYNLDAKKKDPSGFILKLSESITTNNFSDIIFNIEVSNGGTPNIEGPKTFSQGHPSTPGMPADIYGMRIEFDSTEFPATIEFDSTLAPIWGDFFNKGGRDRGQWVYAYNNSFGFDPTPATTDFTNWIPVPGANVVPAPEPGTYLLLGTCLGLALAVQRRRARANN